MLSNEVLPNEVVSALGGIEAAVDALGRLDLSGLTADELVRLAGHYENLNRRQAVLRGDVFHELHRRDVSEIGGAPHKVLADWLRIPPPKPVGAPNSSSRWRRAPA